MPGREGTVVHGCTAGSQCKGLFTAGLLSSLPPGFCGPPIHVTDRRPTPTGSALLGCWRLATGPCTAQRRGSRGGAIPVSGHFMPGAGHKRPGLAVASGSHMLGGVLLACCQATWWCGLLYCTCTALYCSVLEGCSQRRSRRCCQHVSLPSGHPPSLQSTRPPAWAPPPTAPTTTRRRAGRCARRRATSCPAASRWRTCSGGTALTWR